MSNNYTVIGISGKRGSGKDTLAAQMAPLGWQKVSFAAELKERCRKDFGLTEEQTDGHFKESPTEYTRTNGGPLTPRDIMIRCGFYYRSIDPMYWVRIVYRKMEQCDPAWHLDHRKFVITDVRYKNEADFIKDRGGILVRLERDSKLNIYKGAIEDPSETELDDYKRFDLIVPAKSNKVIEDLKAVAKKLEAKYGKGL